MDRMPKIKTATACYTGGNIYIYYGELENGLYFRTCDDWECIEICDADTSTEDADYNEFYEQHSVFSIGGDEYETFWDRMLLWIMTFKPSGNYDSYDLEKRLLTAGKEEKRFTFSLTEEEIKMIRISLDSRGDIKSGDDAQKYYELAERFRHYK